MLTGMLTDAQDIPAYSAQTLSAHFEQQNPVLAIYQPNHLADPAGAIVSTPAEQWPSCRKIPLSMSFLRSADALLYNHSKKFVSGIVSGNLPIPEALSLHGEDVHLACKGTLM